jgi:hypothetical protein
MVAVGGVGVPGFNFILEGSTDLVNWQPLQTNASPFNFTDTNADGIHSVSITRC